MRAHRLQGRCKRVKKYQLHYIFVRVCSLYHAVSTYSSITLQSQNRIQTHRLLFSYRLTNVIAIKRQLTFRFPTSQGRHAVPL